MATGIYNRQKRGTYKPLQHISDHHDFIVKNALKHTYKEIARILNIKDYQLYGYMKRNGIVFLREDRTKSDAPANYSTLGAIRNGSMKNAVTKIDRSAFTNYSNKQHVV